MNRASIMHTALEHHHHHEENFIEVNKQSPAKQTFSLCAPGFW